MATQPVVGLPFDQKYIDQEIVNEMVIKYDLLEDEDAYLPKFLIGMLNALWDERKQWLTFKDEVKHIQAKYVEYAAQTLKERTEEMELAL